MKIQKIILQSALILPTLCGSVSAAILMVDFGTESSAVESGFVRQSGISATHTVVGTASGSLTVSVPGSGNRDRDNPLDNGAFTNGDLFRDLFTGLTRGETATTLSISGLDANTTYSMRLWSVDNGFNDNATYSWYDTTGAGSTLIGTITNAAPAAPTGNNDFSLLFTITSDSSGVIELGHLDTDGTGTINGFVIDAIPEPTSSLLAASALLLGLTRRYR